MAEHRGHLSPHQLDQRVRPFGGGQAVERQAGSGSGGRLGAGRAPRCRAEHGPQQRQVPRRPALAERGQVQPDREHQRLFLGERGVEQRQTRRRGHRQHTRATHP